MGILITCMEMPKSCWDCEFERPTIDHHECCILTKKSYSWGLTEPPSDCPLVEVPKHGRLIDADELLLKIDCHGTNKFGILDEDIREFINEVPTVIQTEEGE